MSYWRPKEMLDIAAGLIPRYAGVNKFGRNPDVDTAADEDIWDVGGTWVPPTTARTHDIASTSTDDDGVNAPGSTGAQTIRVFGLTSWSTAEVSEDITLDGTTNVATANSYVIIHRMQVLTAGSGRTNAGDITATAQTDGTVTAQITAGEGQTLMAIYGVPSGKTLLGTGWYFGLNRTQSTGAVDGQLLVTSNPDVTDPVYRVGHRAGVTAAGTSAQSIRFDPPAPIVGPAIVKVRATDATAINTDVVAGFNGVLMDT